VLFPVGDVYKNFDYGNIGSRSGKDVAWAVWSAVHRMLCGHSDRSLWTARR